MVSLQAAVTSPNKRDTVLSSELDHSSKKRKWDDEPQTDHHHHAFLEKRSKSNDHHHHNTTKSIFEIDLQLETPLPLEWQRCLDIQSGKIHFYNTRTKTRTSRDPRRSTPEPQSPKSGHMSLDLELNLQPCESPKNTNSSEHNITDFGDLLMNSSKENKNFESTMKGCPSWLVEEEDQGEMVAIVCTRCHMLVMLCKSSPSCPNCKFMHPPDHTPPKLFKPRLSLLC